MTFHRCQRFLMPRNVASSPLGLECRKRSTAGHLPRYRKLLLSLHRNRRYLARPFCLLCSVAQWPNIIGAFSVYTACDPRPGGYNYPTVSGAFSVKPIEQAGESYSKSPYRPEYTFSASDSNHMYSSGTVQMPSCQILIIIKI